MSNSTPNLGLFKYNPNVDGKQTFNLDKALNENWDKLDMKVNEIDNKASAVTVPVTKVNNKIGDVILTASDIKTSSGATVESQMADLVTDVNGAHGLKYEEGNWTPILKGSTTAGSNTYVIQIGRYIKINKMVYCSFAIQLSAKDSAMAGNVFIDGLPFAVSDIAASTSFGNSYVSLPTGATDIKAVAGGNSINIWGFGSSLQGSQLQASNILNNTVLNGTIIYKTY